MFYFTDLYTFMTFLKMRMFLLQNKPTTCIYVYVHSCTACNVTNYTINVTIECKCTTVHITTNLCGLLFKDNSLDSKATCTC